MPELPEIIRFAKCLRKTFKGTMVEKLKIRKESVHTKLPVAGYDEFVDLLPLKLKTVKSKGKKIIFVFSKGRYIISSLGTEGKWTNEDIPHSNLYFKIRFSDDTSDKLFYNDTIKQGKIEIYHDKESFEFRMDKIGPDFIHFDITPKFWLNICNNLRVQKMNITQFLMSQEYVSGIGNYIKAEALYRSRINPSVCVFELDEKLLLKLLQNIQNVIDESYEAQGASFKSYYNYDKTKGTFEFQVYGKSEDAKGRKVIRTVFNDGRVTHWVPERQIYPYKWEGPPKMSRKKLKHDEYKVVELKAFCLERGISQKGRKAELVEKLLAY